MNQENNPVVQAGAEQPKPSVTPAYPTQQPSVQHSAAPHQPTIVSAQPTAQSPHIAQPSVAQQPAQSQPIQSAMNSVQNTSGPQESVPVVKVWSIRGVEYAIMSFMLWAIAISVTWVPVALITGNTGFVALSPPLALLLVSLPVFAFFFMRLKKAELLNPEMRTESTKRRFSQITQVVSFFVCFISALTIVSAILASMGGEETSLGQTIGSALVFIVVWGVLFLYYWRDERKF